jgi:hypothetical protein
MITTCILSWPCDSIVYDDEHCKKLVEILNDHGNILNRFRGNYCIFHCRGFTTGPFQVCRTNLFGSHQIRVIEACLNLGR